MFVVLLMEHFKSLFCDFIMNDSIFAIRFGGGAKPAWVPVAKS